jgi:hypothetical protein
VTNQRLRYLRRAMEQRQRQAAWQRPIAVIKRYEAWLAFGFAPEQAMEFAKAGRYIEESA